MRVSHRCAMRLTWLCAGAIAVGTLTPAPQLPDAPGSDKLHHIIGFCALCLPLALSQTVAMWKWVGSALVYGAAIEVIQPHINRSGEWADLIADAIGIGIAIGLGLAHAKLAQANA